MEIQPAGSKIRLSQAETFFDVWPSTSYGFDIRLYPGLSYFAIAKFEKEIDVRLLVFPDKGWFDEWLEHFEKKPKIIFKTGKSMEVK